MGARGPTPKRSDQRRRVNKPVQPVKKGPVRRASEVAKRLPINRSWHPAAKNWYLSLEQSGQSIWYTPSDWATAYVVAEVLSRELKPRQVLIGDGQVVTLTDMPATGAMVAAFLKACSALLVTEGDRRRAQVELEKPKPDGEGEVAGVSEIDEWRHRTGAGAPSPG